MQKMTRMETQLRESGHYDILSAIRFRRNDIGRLILRITIGGLMLFHGMDKLIYGNEQVNQIVTSVGLPAFFAFGVFIGEVLAPIMLIVGYKARLASVFLALDMLIAVMLVHASEFTERNASGGWMLEINALYLLGALAIFFLGSGKLSVTRGKGVLD